MTAISAQVYSRFLFMPRIAVYTFDSEGNQTNFQPVDGYLAAEMGLQPSLDTRDKLMGVLKQHIPEELIVKRNGAEHKATLEELLGNEQPTSGLIVTLPESDKITSKARMGVFAERRETPNWEGARYVPIKETMVSIVRDVTFSPQDPTRAEFGIGDDKKYNETSADFVSRLLLNKTVMKGLNNLVAVVHDLRGTLRYNGFYLAEADFGGLELLIGHLALLTVKDYSRTMRILDKDSERYMAFLRKAYESEDDLSKAVVRADRRLKDLWELLLGKHLIAKKKDWKQEES